MKTFRFTLIVRLACALLGSMATPALQAQQLDLGAAGQYAAFVLHDASGLESVRGRLAVGRDLDAGRLELGAGLQGGDDALAALVVRRNVTHFSDGAIWNGAGRWKDRSWWRTGKGGPISATHRL
jgi:hypothetical protein